MSGKTVSRKRVLLSAAVVGLAASGFGGTSRGSILPAPTVTDSATPFNPSFVAENTVDNTAAEYASQGQGADTFVEYDFGTPQTFDRVVVVNRDSGGRSDLIGNFTLTFDGGTAASFTRTPVRGSSPIHALAAPVTASTVRLDVDTIGTGDTFNNTGAMEVYFLRTPPGQRQAPATVVASAPAFSPFFAAANAADGIVGRSGAGTGDGPEYASQGQGDNTFVDFDLGSLKQVGGFDFFDRIAEADRVTGFDMIFSEDATFGDAGDVTRSYTNSAAALGDVFDTPIVARFIRFDVTDHNPASANTGVSEMVFYQVVPEPGALGVMTLAALGLLARRRH